MKEYIEREALITELNDIAKEYLLDGHTSTILAAGVVTDIKDNVVRQKPSADVVEVVRCKNCIHWGGVTFGNICRRWSAPIAGMKNCTQPDDFCSCGEGKDGV